MTRVEPELIGRTIVDCREFLDGENRRWRELRLEDGTIVQIRLTHPWLILTPEDGPVGPR